MSKETNKDKIKEITDKLEQGVRNLMDSDRYKNYLNVMSKFHKYSTNNVILISMQMPDATHVAGYKAWEKEFQRHVKKGEKAIRIIAPVIRRVKVNADDSKASDTPEEEEVKLTSYRVTSVFDVSQTDGKELPSIVEQLDFDLNNFELLKESLERVSPVPVSYEAIEPRCNGYFDKKERNIVVREKMSQGQTVKTLIHEIAHALLHDDLDLDKELKKDRFTKEVEAESVAYTVCQYLNLDTSDYSFGYVAGWSSGKDVKELKGSLELIRKTASTIITNLNKKLQEVKMENDFNEIVNEVYHEELVVSESDTHQEITYAAVGGRGR